MTQLLDVLNEPWAILPDKKRQIEAIYEAHVRGPKIDLASIEAALGRPLRSPKLTGYDVQDGVAVIEIVGVMGKRMNLFTRISGGVSTQVAANVIRTAMDDPSVEAIALVLDSPGGTVDGTQELMQVVRAAAAKKPVAALADGTMASAAYWVGSAAAKVFASSQVTMVGSIGVVATHVDVSGAEQARGVKTTEVTAGSQKRVVSQYAPLTEEGRAELLAKAQHIYGVFLQDVVVNRGVSDLALAHTQMADGQVFIGQQAIDAGLVDGFATLDEVIALLAAGEIAVRAFSDASGPVRPLPVAQSSLAAGAAASTTTTTEDQIMADQKPDVTAADAKPFVDAAVAEAEKGFAAKAETLKQEGATTERARIQGVLAQSMPGHEAMVQGLAFDGKTTGPEAAVQVLAAEKAKKSETLKLLKADAPDPAKASLEPSPKQKPDETSPAVIRARTQKAQAHIAEQAKQGITVSAADAYDHIVAQEGK
jgi:signal peptide peptidase SppA